MYLAYGDNFYNISNLPLLSSKLFFKSFSLWLSSDVIDKRYLSQVNGKLKYNQNIPKWQYICKIEYIRSVEGSNGMLVESYFFHYGKSLLILM